VEHVRTLPHTDSTGALWHAQQLSRKQLWLALALPISLRRVLAYEHRRAALRAAVAGLPAADDSPLVLFDDEGIIALLWDDFMGGAEEAAIAVDTFLHAIITFRNLCVEQFGG